MLRFGKKIGMETSSNSVIKCKLVSDSEAGPHQSGHRTWLILWSGKHNQTRFKECYVPSVSHNFSFPWWVHIPEPGICDIVLWCQHVATKWCLPRSLQQLLNYVPSHHACICPLTNVCQAMSRASPFLCMSINLWISNNIQKLQSPVYSCCASIYPPNNVYKATSPEQC